MFWNKWYGFGAQVYVSLARQPEGLLLRQVKKSLPSTMGHKFVAFYISFKQRMIFSALWSYFKHVLCRLVVWSSQFWVQLQEISSSIRPLSCVLVQVHYTARFADGTVFDSSYKRARPLTMRIGVGKVWSCSHHQLINSMNSFIIIRWLFKLLIRVQFQPHGKS